jgi:ribosomal protein L40E
MTDDYKQCAQCGEVAAQESSYCRKCGHNQFQELSPELASKLEAIETLASSTWLRIEASRLIIASILSGGLYIFFWLYITWKQLAQETHEEHFPVWHALTWAVPFYQLFRLHRHATVIQGLATQAGVPTTLNPGTIVALALASFGLGMVSLLAVSPGLSMMLGIIGIAVTTTIIVWNQGALNAYWVTRHGDKLRSAPIGPAEVIIVLLGIFVWISTLAR